MKTDAYLDALGDVRRRQLLTALAEENPQLMDHRYAEDSETEEYRIQMHHVHLPKLADRDIIDWDRQTGQITKGPEFEAIRPLIECLRQETAEFPSQ